MGVDENGYKESEDDLRIPVLKSPVYTTGRGGTVSACNMRLLGSVIEDSSVLMKTFLGKYGLERSKPS